MQFFVLILVLQTVAYGFTKGQEVVASSTEAPSYIANFYKYDVKIGFGVLLSNRHIVSAAHILYGVLAENLKIRVGVTAEIPLGITYSANEIHIYDAFNWITWEHDVAVVTASSEFIFSNSVTFMSIYNIPVAATELVTVITIDTVFTYYSYAVGTTTYCTNFLNNILPILSTTNICLLNSGFNFNFIYVTYGLITIPGYVIKDNKIVGIIYSTVGKTIVSNTFVDYLDFFHGTCGIPV